MTDQRNPPLRVLVVWAIVLTTIAAGLLLTAYILTEDGDAFALWVLVASGVVALAAGVLWVIYLLKRST